MFWDELKKRNVPSLKSRAEMLELLQREEYGCLPKAPESFVWKAEPGVADNFCAGKATLEKLTFRVVVNGKDFVFPVYLAVPTAEGPHPFFVYINFRSERKYLQSLFPTDVYTYCCGHGAIMDPNAPMPGICLLNSTASSKAKITPAGTVSTQYQSVLSSAVMN